MASCSRAMSAQSWDTRSTNSFPVPQVVAGFEAEDILLGLVMLVRQVKEGTHRVDNAYPRAVCREGNVKAKKIMYEVFEPSDVEWRGFPVIPGPASG